MCGPCGFGSRGFGFCGFGILILRVWALGFGILWIWDSADLGLCERGVWDSVDCAIWENRSGLWG